MQRYRVKHFDFDARANILKLKIQDEWEGPIKQQWETIKADIKTSLIAEYGASNQESKLERFIEIGAKPVSILAFHNQFFEECRKAYIIGAFYPALTATCALGERIFNHLLLKLRDDFKKEPDYKNIYRKKQFDDWNKAINILANWGVLQKDVANLFRKLAKIRNQAIHFMPEVDTNARELALDAIKTLTDIIDQQFGTMGSKPWFYEDQLGFAFIKKEWEGNPFIQHIYVPNCAYVSPFHGVDEFFQVVDYYKGQQTEITDKEFYDLYREYMEGRITPLETLPISQQQQSPFD